MMKIGIDARLINETGVGRYIRNLVVQLGIIDKENQYVIFLKKDSYGTFKLPNNRWQKRLADIPWHSLTEQIIMPIVFSAEKLDLLHVPYFNVPILYPGKFIVTIHDLTILHFNTGRATTLPWIFYKLRRLGYYLALSVGLTRAQKVIAVSESTKQEIIKHFYINPEKIVVTHEGVEDNLKTQISKLKSQKKQVTDRYFLYVGNAYPHKNLEILIKAFGEYLSKHLKEKTRTKLVLAGPDDYFYRRLSATVNATNFELSIKMLRSVKEEELRGLYKSAEALVFPSLMEGFGLPGLEAMVAGTPVVCSDIPVFHEIYGEAALYFNPNSELDIAEKLQLVATNQALRKGLIDKGKKRVAAFNWRRMAEQTSFVYQGC